MARFSAVIIQPFDLPVAHANPITIGGLCPLSPVADGAILWHTCRAFHGNVFALREVYLTSFASFIAFHGANEICDGRHFLDFVKRPLATKLASSAARHRAEAVLPVCPHTVVLFHYLAGIALHHLPGIRGSAGVTQLVAQVANLTNADPFTITTVAGTPLVPVVPLTVHDGAAGLRCTLLHLLESVVARLATEPRRSQQMPVSVMHASTACLGAHGP
mmetsp:Transcript_19953/g.35409  ORF Transcript_19953/g.35409 Transcript_19953/m.35409 type:complete len:218 (-) Transcript_19953:1918-2571(-)